MSEKKGPIIPGRQVHTGTDPDKPKCIITCSTAPSTESVWVAEEIQDLEYREPEASLWKII